MRHQTKVGIYAAEYSISIGVTNPIRTAVVSELSAECWVGALTVVSPIRGRRQSDTLTPYGQREDFAWKHPSDRSEGDTVGRGKRIYAPG